MLFISTILNRRKTINRLRYRLGKIAINIYISRAIFREIIIKDLNILEFINIYNYYINGVNNIN